ncbi:hypothetical protein P12x_002416 [Tundrisphaera lichenicola]|uniref:hypothetical protein n=1 Tax=Tundrisphaera lichenicola TaxID=2029860 RepID=UPI003EC129C0
MRSILLRWSCVSGLLLLAGCGVSSNQTLTEADMQATALNDVGELYRIHQTSKNKPPMKLKDLAAFEQGAPIGLNAIRTGDVVVRYGATLPFTGEGTGKGGEDEVLAYEKQVPESGGQVLMLDRSIKQMTAEEFKSAKLAGNE